MYSNVPIIVVCLLYTCRFTSSQEGIENLLTQESQSNAEPVLQIDEAIDSLTSRLSYTLSAVKDICFHIFNQAFMLTEFTKGHLNGTSDLGMIEKGARDCIQGMYLREQNGLDTLHKIEDDVNLHIELGAEIGTQSAIDNAWQWCVEMKKDIEESETYYKHFSEQLTTKNREREDVYYVTQEVSDCAEKMNAIFDVFCKHLVRDLGRFETLVMKK